MTRESLLRPEFGPTLPELVSRRLPVSRRAVSIALAALVILIVVAIKVALGIGRSTLTVHGKPSFSVVYKTGELHKSAPRPGELLRIEGRRRHVSVAVTARHVTLPPFSGDVIAGQLPLYVSTYADRLKARLSQFAISDEGKARIGQAQGYDIGYQSGPKGNHTYWREIFLVPGDGKGDQTVALLLRQTFSGPTGPRGQALVQAAKQAYHSFRFGSHRPLFSSG